MGSLSRHRAGARADTKFWPRNLTLPNKAYYDPKRCCNYTPEFFGRHYEEVLISRSPKWKRGYGPNDYWTAFLIGFFPADSQVDIGRTSTKTCVSRQPDKVVLIPSNVAQLSVEQVRRGSFEAALAAPLMDIWLEYQGKGYAMGQLAADYGANLGLGESKVENALLKVFGVLVTSSSGMI